MLEAAHRVLRAEGVKLSVLVPSSAALYNFYGKRGFDTEFYSGLAVVGREEIAPFAGSFFISEADPLEFMQIRERAVRRAHDVRALGRRRARLPDDRDAFGGGETLAITIGDARAIAVCTMEGGRVNVKELALDGMAAGTALSVLQHKFGADEYHLAPAARPRLAPIRSSGCRRA